ncbi:MAG: 2-hydroxyacyl-CoA dehydratase [Synergistes sp.]|nr:2-hydroxyacyl-CoA dehydratase [Synergistes sp.]
MSSIVAKFGAYIGRLARKKPEKVRQLIIPACRAKKIQFKYFSQKRQSPARNHLSEVLIDSVLAPYLEPENSALVNFHFPCELLYAMGIHPNVSEAVSGSINAFEAEKYFVEYAENAGISETLCSYHKIMLGTVLSGVLPKPAFVANVSLVCDANSLTFPMAANHWQVPHFMVDVPLDRSPEGIAYVADQLREFKDFLEDVTGKRLQDERLKESVACTGRTIEKLARAQQLKKYHYLQNDLEGEVFEMFASHILLGTREIETYADLLCRDLERSNKTKGLRLLWMHVIPYYITPLKKLLNFNPKCQIVTSEMNFDGYVDIDPEKPYESMAKRLVLNAYNGSAVHRMESTLKMCRELDIDGVVYFCHWGCKQTAGASDYIKEALESAGYPVLILNGDGCNRNNSGEGQLMTRIEAFTEMLEKRKSL